MSITKYYYEGRMHCFNGEEKKDEAQRSQIDREINSVSKEPALKKF